MNPSPVGAEGLVLRGEQVVRGRRQMGCPGDVEGCAAEVFRCPCGVLACEVHGHADEGDDPYCPQWRRAEILDETDGRGYENIDLSTWGEGHG